MKTPFRSLCAFVPAIAIVAALIWFFSSGRQQGDIFGTVPDAGAELPSDFTGNVRFETNGSVAVAAQVGENVAAEEDDDDLPPEEEEKVKAFYSMIDQWRSVTNAVSVSDATKFSEAFKSVPDARREVCLHRALNLLSDDRVMLLSGILMDKTLPKDTLEVVLHDIMNRKNEVKDSVLQALFKDKNHPCWEEVAWILDATGSLKEK